MTGAAVVAVGSVNTDIDVLVNNLPRSGETVTAQSFDFGEGGKGANAAVAAARMGIAVALIAVIGREESEAVLSKLTRAGVDVTGMRLVTERTGYAIAIRDANGENSVISYSGANARLTADTVRQEILRRRSTTRVVLANLEVPDEAVLAAARAARDIGAKFVLDPAPARALGRELEALCYAVLPNETELEKLNIQDHPRLIPFVVQTRGARGTQLNERGTLTEFGAFDVSAIDTVGAGDAFAGALAAALAEDRGVHEAIRIAGAAGALTTQTRGARANFVRADIDDLITGSSDT